MEWRHHISPEDQIYINNHHGTEHFKKIVSAGLNQAAFHTIKLNIAKEHHQNFEGAWRYSGMRGNPFNGIREHVDGKISNMMVELDNRTGARGQKGLAWVDEKAHALWQHIRVFF